MIKLCTGDILKANTKAIVIPVNCAGVMGKGLAKQFKDKYPSAYHIYKARCDGITLKPGGLITVNAFRSTFSHADFLAIMLATKSHWRQPSKLEWIIDGVNNLREYIDKTELASIAMPKIGCGYGGLRWKVVKPIIFAGIGLSSCEVHIYE